MKKPKPIIMPCAKLEADSPLRFGNGTEADDRRQRKILAAATKHLPPGAYEMELRPFPETRRDRQNRYYWGVVIKLMAEESGYEPEDLHEWLRLQHNAKTVADPQTGEEIKIGQSTARLTVQEFSDYLERCMVTGAEMLGITFPEPRPSDDYREEHAA